MGSSMGGVLADLNEELLPTRRRVERVLIEVYVAFLSPVAAQLQEARPFMYMLTSPGASPRNFAANASTSS